MACYRFDLVSINPVMMLGPVVSAYGSSNSIMEMKLALEGNEFKTLSNKVPPCAARFYSSYLYERVVRAVSMHKGGRGSKYHADIVKAHMWLQQQSG